MYELSVSFLWRLNFFAPGETAQSTCTITSPWRLIQTTSELCSRYCDHFFVLLFVAMYIDEKNPPGRKRLNPEEEPGRLVVAIACESVMWFVIFA